MRVKLAAVLAAFGAILLGDGHAALISQSRLHSTALRCGCTTHSCSMLPVSRQRSRAVALMSLPDDEAEANAPAPPTDFGARASEAAGAVYRFSRPHTIRGTLLACFTGVGRALFENPVRVHSPPPIWPCATALRRTPHRACIAVRHRAASH